VEDSRDKIIAEANKINKNFGQMLEGLESIGKEWSDYRFALDEFNEISDKMTQEFVVGLAILFNKNKKVYKVATELEEGWIGIMANAKFVFGDDEPKVKIENNY